MTDAVSPIPCGSGNEKHPDLMHDGGDGKERAESVVPVSAARSVSGKFEPPRLMSDGGDREEREGSVASA